MGTIRLATASPATKPTTRETLAHLARLARAASSGPSPADFLLLPEAYLGGYPRGSTFGCAIGGRSAAGRDEYLAYFKGAVDLGDIVGESGGGAGDAWVRREIGKKKRNADDDEMRGDGTREELERIARETGVFIVVGCVEKAGGSLYCSVVYVCPSKGMIGKRRKVMPTGSERLVWAQGSPSTLRAVTTTVRGTRVNLAAAICWENYIPLLRQSLYAQNVNLYLAPTADGRDAWLSLMRTVAIEGRCFVASSNMAARSPGTGLGLTAPEPVANGPSHAAKGPSHAVNGTSHAVLSPTPELSPRSTNANGQAAARARRRSIPCGDGNEIIVPESRSQPPALPARSQSSVLHEQGNQFTFRERASVPHRPRRRSSLVCADGSEMAYPPSISSWPPGPDPEEPGAEPPMQPMRATGPTRPAVPVQNGTSKGWSSRGGSCIVSPFGDVLAGPQWEDDEGIIYADLDFDDCIRGRLDLDTAGSYSRNDSFKFSVDGLDLEALPY